MSSDLKPPAHLSVSSIQTFQQCPQKFKFNKIDLIPDKPGQEAVLGNFVHDILEELYKYSPEERNIQTAKFLAKKMWDERWGDQAGSILTKSEDLHSFRWNAWWCVENLWDIEDPVKVNPVGLEHEVNAEVGGVRIKGFIDRISQSPDSIFLTISDYKTGKVPRPEYEDDKFFQLYVYANLLSITGVGEADKVELIYLKGSKKIVRGISDADISRSVEVIQETKSEIDNRCSSGHFEANKSILCNWCGYKPICPVWKK